MPEQNVQAHITSPQLSDALAICQTLPKSDLDQEWWETKVMYVISVLLNPPFDHYIIDIWKTLFIFINLSCKLRPDFIFIFLSIGYESNK